MSAWGMAPAIEIDRQRALIGFPCCGDCNVCREMFAAVIRGMQIQAADTEQAVCLSRHRAREAGMGARREGQPLQSNPHRDTGRWTRYSAWADGWLDIDRAIRLGELLRVPLAGVARLSIKGVSGR